MTAPWQHYYTPTTVAGALRLMAEHGAHARLIAGGTDLILDLRDRQMGEIAALVDVTQIEGLAEIGEEGAWIVLGAAVTHSQIERSALLRRHAAALVESCRVVGGPQVRNVATIGGNIAHALPAADGAIGLLALDAQVQVATLVEDTAKKTVAYAWQPLLDIYAGPGRNTLAQSQMLTAFRFAKPGPHTASAFDRIMRPQGVALPILGVAARLSLAAGSDRVQEASLAVGPAGPVPFRAKAAEAALVAAPALDDAAITAAIDAAQAEVQLRTSLHRASKEYRHEMLTVLLRRVVRRAFAAASAQKAG